MEVNHIQSICVGCSVGCGIDVLVKDNRVLRVDGLWDVPVNGGILCERGRYQETQEQTDRITTPLVRKNGNLVPTSWDEAIDLTAENLSHAQKDDKISAVVSTRLPGEVLYTFKEVFKANENITSIEEDFTTINNSIGLYGSLEDLKSSDCVLVLGADLVKNHQVSGFFVKRNLSKGSCLIVVDPYHNAMESFAHYSLQPTQGTDKDLLEGLIAATVSLGLNKDTPPTRITPSSLANASKACNIPRELLVSVAREIACAERLVIVLGKGLIQEKSKETFLVLEEYSKLVKASAIINTKGKANSTTAQKLKLDKAIIKEPVTAAYIVLGDDYAPDRLVNHIKDTPFIAVQASYSSKLTECADVVFPVETCFEQEGIYINLDGRMQHTHRALIPASGIKSNLDVLKLIAQKMNVEISSDWETELVS